jgi:hypothetical protein
MNHILKKISIAGGGGGNEPKPPVYKPPILGELQYGSSISFAETIDLISDGPIEGLVDRNGRVLEELRILQGIYLDDTPVAVSNRKVEDVLSSREEDAANLFNVTLDNADGTGTKNCQKFFEELGKIDERGGENYDTRVSTLPPAGALGGNATEEVAWPNAALYFTKHYRKASAYNGRGSSQYVRGWWPWHLFDLRAFIKNRIATAVTFPWFINNRLRGYRNTTVSEGIDDDNALFNRGPDVIRRDREYGHMMTGREGGEGRKWAEWGIHDHLDLFWTDNEDVENGKFMFAVYGPNEFEAEEYEDSASYMSMHNNEREEAARWGSRHVSASDQYWPESVQRIQEFVEIEINDIHALWVKGQEEGGNWRQAALAEKALSRFGWNGGVDGDLDKLIASVMETTEDGRYYGLVVVKLNETGSSVLTESLVANADGQLINMITRPYGTSNEWSLEAALAKEGVQFFDFTCPVIDNGGVMQQEMKGFLFMKIPLEKTSVDVIASERNTERRFLESLAWMTVEKGIAYSVPEKIHTLLTDIESFRYSKTLIPNRLLGNYGITDLKFNFTNILAEFRKGEEFQDPLSHFKTVYIDHVYGRKLFGPFSVSRKATEEGLTKPEGRGFSVNSPQRIAGNRDMLTREHVLERGAVNFNLNMANDLPVEEGSDDLRIGNRGGEQKPYNFSDWSPMTWDEEGVSVTHTVYNPNVTRAMISLHVLGLSDTLTFEVDNVRPENEDMELANRFPTVVNIRVETGTLGRNSDGTEGLEIPYETYTYRIVALIEGSTIIDLGNPDYRADSTKEFVVSLDGKDPNLNAGFALPPTVTNKQIVLSENGEEGVKAGSIDQDSTEKRYIKVSKLSFETNSVLLTKKVELRKVSEIIDVPIPYPFSAIVGTRIDSRSFSSIPRRTYDCKLKKVRVPSNYFPTKYNGEDKRYFDNQIAFDQESKLNKQIYKGDWDGSFKSELEWTDNPAWILYDLLVSDRYGMGSHINTNDINIWELYRIGRFCDAVDDFGYFEGVSDGRGGKEPRFSCNIMFDQGQKIFDAINTIASIFRGRVFFSNSSISFVDDRPRNPVNIFTNENVKDGLFYYSNNRRDEQYNCIEVAFKDRFDNFSPQIEVVEDEDNIKEKGIFKKRIEGLGITSRAMARRVAQHQIFSKITENQQVAFTAGLESLLCKPGDLVFIEDELKTNKANFGKVLDVDTDNEIIRVSNTFVEGSMTGILTVMNPTGSDTDLDIQTGYADVNRQRYDQLQITGEASSFWVRYTGDYTFSGYREGYPDASGTFEFASEELSRDTRYQQYAVYTGLPETGGNRPDSFRMVYFNTSCTGWVFSSGSITTGIPDVISRNTGAQTFATVGAGEVVAFDQTKYDCRGTTGYAFHGFNPASFLAPATRGALPSDVDNVRPDQLTVLRVTGTILQTPSSLETAGYNNYGTVISGFDRPDVLPFIKLGSAAKFELVDASPFIYKVTAMKEENVNEYLVTATKYETGKFKLIEDDVSIENKVNTFSYQTSQQIGDITYDTLPAPTILSVITGVPSADSNNFSVSGNWSSVENSTGYDVTLTLPNGAAISQSVQTTGFQFDNQNTVGMFNYSVSALGNNGTNPTTNAYFDSVRNSSGIFVVYDDLLPYTVSFVNRITVL